MTDIYDRDNFGDFTNSGNEFLPPAPTLCFGVDGEIEPDHGDQDVVEAPQEIYTMMPPERPQDDTAEYRSVIEELDAQIRQWVRDRKPPTLDEIMSGISVGRDNRMIRETCAELHLATRAEFDKACRRERVRAALGSAPESAADLVAAYARKFEVEAQYDGAIVRKTPQKLYGNPIEQGARDDALVDLACTIMVDRAGKIDRLGMERELRMLSDEHKLGISRDDISDAVTHWFEEAKRARLFDIISKLGGKEPYFNARQGWLSLAERCFDCRDTSPEFVVAVLKKFCWQVKRKIVGLPISNHLMVVILGPQGAGKSTMVHKLLEPIAELAINVDFKAITDERNVDIWSSYAMLFDEMGFASKADIDNVKNVITATKLTRRPMRTNATIAVEQNATMIGCSNKELAQLIRDPTGIRRFVGLRMRADNDRKLINALEWQLMWGDVDHTAADPMDAFSEELAALQAETRELARVEQWIMDIDCNTNGYYSRDVNRAGNISGVDLYQIYREYEEDNFPGNYKTSKPEWDHEMARISNNSPETMIFEKKRGAAGMMYRWNGIVHNQSEPKSPNSNILALVNQKIR